MRTNDDVSRAAKLSDNQTGNRKDVKTSSSCFSSEHKVAEHFTCFTRTGKIHRNLYFRKVIPQFFNSIKKILFIDALRDKRNVIEIMVIIKYRHIKIERAI